MNEEGAPAYTFGPKHRLAQYAMTGCMNRTFYASAEAQVEKVLELALEVEPEFVAKAAVYCREKGFMKDMPALLTAVLAVRNPALLPVVFERVIDSGKMLRNFVQILRSGVVGRKSLGTLPKRLVRNWLARSSDEALFRASVGNDPSLADIVKMVHPRPETPAREALYGYLIGKNRELRKLPALVRAYEAYKKGETRELPDVPFQMLTSLDLGREAWREIARKAKWHMTRMNLNTFARHGVLEEREMAALIADRLADREGVRKARAFPYQLLAAYLNASDGVPGSVRNALQDAMETATENVPVTRGKVFVCPDVSGSMQSAVTGYRKG
ncbi:MAG: TROVE domain-containing protein, partial [Planctomycetota bacterium]